MGVFIRRLKLEFVQKHQKNHEKEKNAHVQVYLIEN